MPKVTPSSRRKKIATIKEGKKKSFPIVAIGASAGGLEAVSQLLKNLPADTGMTFFMFSISALTIRVIFPCFYQNLPK